MQIYDEVKALTRRVAALELNAKPTLCGRCNTMQQIANAALAERHSLNTELATARSNWLLREKGLEDALRKAESKAEHYRTCRVEGITAERDDATARLQATTKLLEALETRRQIELGEWAVQAAKVQDIIAQLREQTKSSLYVGVTERGKVNK